MTPADENVCAASSSQAREQHGHFAVSVSRQIVWYISIARPHHYPKNLLVLIGSILASRQMPDSVPAVSPWLIIIGVFSTCMIASSNYVLNEILDADQDRFHPRKKGRPMVNGSIPRINAYIEWMALGTTGLIVAAWIGTSFFIWSAIFFLMAVIYNVPPIRLKDVPYVDVLTEAINSPLRLLMGWTIVVPTSLPDVETVLAFWAAGACMMARKRLMELPILENREAASAYRKSFIHYDKQRLLASIILYALLAAMFCGLYGHKLVRSAGASESPIVIVRHHGDLAVVSAIRPPSPSRIQGCIPMTSPLLSSYSVASRA